MKVNKSILRTAGIAAAFLAGYMIPQMHCFSFLIRYLIIAMLFIVFLRVRVGRNAFHPSQLRLLLANLAMGPSAYAAVRIFGGSHALAQGAFFAAITPTATAAPVVTGFLGGNTGYVIGGFLLTNAGVAMALPWLIPCFTGIETPGVTLSVFSNLAFIMGVPLAASLILRRIYPPAEKWPSKLGDFSFSLWLAALFLIAANASDFIRRHSIGAELLRYLAVTAAVCMVNFLLGYIIVPARYRREGSQTLGQKNTTLTIYLALTYANPLVATGPACYVLWHNLWNAIQLSRAGVNSSETRRQRCPKK